MKRVLYSMVLLVCFSLITSSLFAQNSTIPTQKSPQLTDTTFALPFDLEEFFNFDNFMFDLQKEMDATKDIWSQFLNPLLVDSMVNQLHSFDIGGSVDTILQKFKLGIEQNGDMGIGNLLNEFFDGFDLNGSFSPFSIPPQLPLDSSEWKVVPQIPPTNPQNQPTTPSKPTKAKVII